MISSWNWDFGTLLFSYLKILKKIKKEKRKKKEIKTIESFK
jgi:hypothetical protein